MSFANQLKALRDKKRLSQSQAAALVPGLSVRTFQEWEQEHQEPAAWVQALVLERLSRARARRAKS